MDFTSKGLTPLSPLAIKELKLRKYIRAYLIKKRHAELSKEFRNFPLYLEYRQLKNPMKKDGYKMDPNLPMTDAVKEHIKLNEKR